MCGRVQQVETASEIAAYYGCDGPLPNMERRYNGAPGQDYLVVRYNPATGKRSVDVLQWGLVTHQEPDWAKARKHINARGEAIHRFPAFKDSFEKRRCLLPVSHFFEWKGLKPPKQPYACAKRDHTPFAVAAIWDAWKDPATGEWRRTFCIVTCEPNALMARIHDRMPVIVDPVNHAAWLGQSGASVDEIRKLLVPYPSELMTMWPIDQKMNTWKYNDPDTSDPIGDEEFAGD